MEEFVLPKEITQSSGVNPRDLVIVSVPKMGKGTILGDFTENHNALVFDLEKGGYEYINARKVSVYPTQETTFIEAYKNYVGYRNALLEDKGRYDYLIVDTLTELDKFSDLGGTFMYMNDTKGKNFNVDPVTKQKYPPEHPNFKKVSSLPDGAGYMWTRTWFMEQIELFSQIAPYRIYAAHVQDKALKESLNNDEVVGSEISLTGKLKTIFSSKVTTLCKMITEGNKRYLSFDVMNDSIIAGSRAPHLSGKILISEKEGDQIKTYWNNIYV